MSEKPDLSNLKILLIDDEFFMLDVIARSLRGIGVNDVVKASDCGEAIGVITRDRLQFDCIIADFNMKPMNGLQFLQRIRTGQEPKIPRSQAYIMLTGNARSEVVKASLLLDVNAYLVKPVAAAKLSDALERVTSLKWKLKTPAHYEAVNIQVTESFNDAEDRHRASLISPPKSIFKPAAGSAFINRKKLDAAPAVKLVPEAKPEREPIMIVRRCSLEKLKEKMVMGEDIAATDGTVLVTKGTQLSAKMVRRLQEAAADRKFVLVEKKI